MSANQLKLYINGRFLTQSISGVQRYAYEFIKTVDERISQKDPLLSEYHIEILAPRNINQAYEVNFKNIVLHKIGTFSGHMWEQLELPFYCRDGILFCPGNTAPCAN